MSAPAPKPAHACTLGSHCALGGAITEDDARVRITTPVIPKAKKYKDLSLPWVASQGVSYFHEACWSVLVGKSGAGTRKRARRPEWLSALDIGLLETVEDTLERFDDTDTMKEKAKEVARILSASSRGVVFTGAGISVAAGLPTYRGVEGIDTLAEVGRESEEAVVEKPKGKGKKGTKRKAEEEEDPAISASDTYLNLHPTLSHMFLSRAVANGHLDKVITQNCDDLHARSGISEDHLIELHGNVFIEFCEKCEREYRRPYCVDLFSTEAKKEKWYRECPTCGWGHYTGRVCDVKGCKGKLKDTIVNFGDDLHEKVLGGLPAAEAACKVADVVFALGASLTVTPACNLPTLKPREAPFVLVNLQATDFDDLATVRVWGYLDPFFAEVEREYAVLKAAPTAVTPTPTPTTSTPKPTPTPTHTPTTSTPKPTPTPTPKPTTSTPKPASTPTPA